MKQTHVKGVDLLRMHVKQLQVQQKGKSPINTSTSSTRKDWTEEIDAAGLAGDMRPNFSSTTVPTVQIVERRGAAERAEEGTGETGFDGRKPAGRQI